MKATIWISRVLLFIVLMGFPRYDTAQPSPPGGGSPNIQLNNWGFDDTDWLSDSGYPPLKFTNLVNVTSSGDGNCLLLDTSNSTPAYLLYRVIETDGFTNLLTTNGSISLWFNPSWSSTNRGGTGPGNWANLISMGYSGTNGPWWAWYLSSDGCTIYFTAQTNGGAASNSLVAPVSFAASNWYNLVLTYSRTNSSFYTNGVLVTNGTGVAQSGLAFSYFAIGSDSNGFYQSEGSLDDVATYNYQLASTFISGTYGIYSLFYDFPHPLLTNAPSPPPTITAPRWFTGTGFVQFVTNASICVTNSNVWLTNVSAIALTNGTTSITFTIAGGSNGVPYDVFGTTLLVPPHATNADWAWLGQGYQCGVYTVTNLSFSTAFLILGGPKDTDGDGLTDAFEGLVSKTSPTTANTFGGLPDAWVALNGLLGNPNLASQDPDLDDLSNGQEYLYGTKPLVSEGFNIWVSNPGSFSAIP